MTHILYPSKHWRTQNPQRSIDAGLMTKTAFRIYSLLQQQAFKRELTILNSNEPSSDGSRFLKPGQVLPKDSLTRRLCLFLDSNGLLRVGDRLDLSNFSYDIKHPLILPSGHVSQLIVSQAHDQCLHGGITLTFSTVRQRVWILQARKLVICVLARCVIYSRQRAETPTQLMGSLPPARINPQARAFTECGVDYVGPYKIRLAGGRGHMSQLAYVALFVCMATRAIHLELVSDYSTPAFLAFQRFYSRRGLPTVVYNDCGTNFVGADRELCAAYREAINSEEFRVRMAVSI